MSELSEFKIGQTVELSDGRTAIIQYIGNPQFAPGDWLGVVLDDATGKNDGSVQGKRYFECRPGHGMFLRPAAVTVIIDEPTPKPKERSRLRANGAAAKTRPQSITAGGLKRQSLADPGASKRQSINAGSPTPGANGALRARLGVCHDLLISIFVKIGADGDSRLANLQQSSSARLAPLAVPPNPLRLHARPSHLPEPVDSRSHNPLYIPPKHHYRPLLEQ